MKKIFTSILLMLTITAVCNAQATAVNWTAQDCDAVSHTLHDELDSGKIIVFVWVMPCGSCVGPAKAAYDAAQSFAASNPGKVQVYIADDYGDATCLDLTNWITANSIGSMTNIKLFPNTGNAIKMTDFGGNGMPRVTVMAGNNHKIYYNEKNTAANNMTAIKTSINDALADLSVMEAARQISFSVAPNPVTESFTVTYPKSVEKVIISSATGQIVKEASFGKGKLNPTVSLGGIASGIYIVKVIDAGGKSGMQKIVKQ